MLSFRKFKRRNITHIVSIDLSVLIFVRNSKVRFRYKKACEKSLFVINLKKNNAILKKNS